MRRLNRVPVLIFVGGICLVVGVIGYTYKARLQSAAAATHDADRKPEGATGAAVLNGAPETGEVQSATLRPMVAAQQTPTPAQAMSAQGGPSDGGQRPGADDDPATQARKQAWQTYYQQLASLQQSGCRPRRMP
jgi:hypothetical protein